MSEHDQTLASHGQNDRTFDGRTRDGGHGDDDHGDDHHDDHHGVGAHEVDKMPSSRLFNLLFGLSALTLVACIGVVQLFYRQVDTIRDTRNAKTSFQLEEYRQEMEALASSWTLVEFTDDDGVPEAQGGKSVHDTRRTHMPLAEARKRVLEEPQKYLKAERPSHPRWPNPDPNAPKVVAPTGPRPMGRAPLRIPSRPTAPTGAAPGAKVPAGGMVPTPVPTQPAGAKPTDGNAPAEAPAKGEAKPAKPEGKAPAKGEGKAPAKPAKGEGKSPE